MPLIQNKKAYFNYEILEKFEAGLSLRGFEVKSILLGRAALKGGRVIIRNNEAFSVGVHIPPYQKANTPKEYEPDRARKLLLHKKEIMSLLGKIQQKGLTLVPLKVYNKGRRIKLEFAIVRGKKKYDKRAVISKRESKRNIERSLKIEN